MKKFRYKNLRNYSSSCYKELPIFIDSGGPYGQKQNKVSFDLVPYNRSQIRFFLQAVRVPQFIGIKKCFL